MRKWQFYLSCGIASVAILLVGIDGWLAASNRQAMADIQSQQAQLQQAAQLQSLYTSIAKGLAERALQTKDQQVLNMLAAQGLKVTPNATSEKPEAKQP